MTSKVTLKGYIIVPMEELELVKVVLIEHEILTRKEPGCIVFDVIQNRTDPARFDVYEEFVDAAAFDSHQQRVSASRWGEVTINVERHYELA